MTDRPMVFSASMIRALIREAEQPGTGKTQTRRIIKPRGRFSLFDGQWTDDYVLDAGNEEWRARDVRYVVGDRLWVRETICADDDEETWDHVVRYFADDATIKAADCNDVASDAFGRWWLLKSYRSDDPDLTGGKPVPSIHMPRWASRLTLHVTEVRVERLQDISQADVIAEGVTHRRGEPISDCVAGWHEPYAELWNSLHGLDAWDRNPWVAVIAFRPVLANIDTPSALLSPDPVSTDQGAVDDGAPLSKPMHGEG